MCSSPDSDCTSLEYTIMVPGTLKPLCQGTSAVAIRKRNSDNPKKYCPPIDGGESLAVATWLVATFLFNYGNEYRTINLHRSAVSVIHEYIDGLPVGKHPRICSLVYLT